METQFCAAIGSGRVRISVFPQAVREEGDGEPAAPGSKRRCCKIRNRRMPAGREMLKAFENAGVYPKHKDDPHRVPCLPIILPSRSPRNRHRQDNAQAGSADGSHHFLRRQQREDGEKNDATPCEDAKGYQDGAGAHRWTLSIAQRLAIPSRPAPQRRTSAIRCGKDRHRGESGKRFRVITESPGALAGRAKWAAASAQGRVSCPPRRSCYD